MMPSYLIRAYVNTIILNRQQTAPDTGLHIHDDRIDGNSGTGINRIRHTNFAIIHAVHSLFQLRNFLLGPFDFPGQWELRPGQGIDLVDTLLRQAAHINLAQSIEHLRDLL